jgi:hypothetical protein
MIFIKNSIKNKKSATLLTQFFNFNFRNIKLFIHIIKNEFSERFLIIFFERKLKNVHDDKDFLIKFLHEICFSFSIISYYSNFHVELEFDVEFIQHLIRIGMMKKKSPKKQANINLSISKGNNVWK